jgi:hypothetical protein
MSIKKGLWATTDEMPDSSDTKTALHGECSSDILYYDKPIIYRRAGETVWDVISDDPKLQSIIPGPTLYFGFLIKKSDDATASDFQKDPSFDNYTS